MPTAIQIRTQLDRILAGRAFDGAERAKSFLTFVITTALDGRSEEIKESVIAVEALGRSTNFDPKTDPIVRVEAGRLRTRLKTFYESQGLNDPIVIELPKGSYVPEFSERSDPGELPAAFNTRTSLVKVGAGLVSGILLTSAAWLLLSKPPARAEVLRLSLNLPAGTISQSARISPDGTKVAFTALQGSRSALCVRSLDSSGSRVIPGTESATQPFWSPDSRSIGFFTSNRLLRVELAGGPAQEICAATIPTGGGTWSRDGTIVFAPKPAGALYKVPASGGVPQPATQLDTSRGEFIHRSPEFLPDGKHFLYVSNSSRREATALRAGSTGSVESAVLLEAGGGAAYAPPMDGRAGSLLFYFHGALVAQPFDPAQLKFTGPRTTLAPEIAYKDGHADYSVSANGTLLFLPASRKTRQLGWYDRNGRLIENIGEHNDYYDLHLSRDDERIVFTDEEPDWTSSIWMMNLRQRRLSRVTNLRDPSFHPVWSPDGLEVMFSTGNDQRMRLMRQSIDSAVAVTALDTPGPKFPTDWSDDGRFVMYLTSWPEFNRLRTIILDLKNPAPRVLYETRYSETEATFSPTRPSPRWIAYSSNETGQREVYVRDFPQLTRKWQVSSGGGWQPIWSRNGRELFYVSADGILMAAAIRPGTEFRADPPHPLFRINIGSYPAGTLLPAYSYAVSRDGERFLIDQETDGASANAMSVITHWQSTIP